MDYAPLVTLEGVNGEQFALSAMSGAGQVFLRKGAQGLDMIPWDVQVDEYPVLPGASVRDARGQQREIFLPLTIWGETRPQMVAAKRRLMAALDPARMHARMPKLIVAEVNEAGVYEDQREIEVYYADGLNGDEGSDNGLTWNKFGLVLRSSGGPFFSARSDTSTSFYQYPAPQPFFPDEDQPFVSPDGLAGGFKLSGTPVFGTVLPVNNPGDISAYPTWEITGPISAPFQLVRAATAFSPEQSLNVVSLNLTNTQTWTLVTEPGRLRSITEFGPDAGWTALATNPQFWALDPGPNTVSIQGLSVGEVPLGLAIIFRAKYQGM